MLKLVDEEYLTNYNSIKQEEPALEFKDVTPIYQGRHLCHDKKFIEAFKQEFKISSELESAALKPPLKLGKLFGAKSYYNEKWFTE